MELTLSDVGIRGTLSTLGCLLFISSAVYQTTNCYRQWRQGVPLTAHNVAGLLSAYGLAILLGWQGYIGVSGRHLLRVSGRYTNATVMRARRIKFRWESHYVYAVGGVQYTDYIGQGSLPALPLGSRWYVRYAAADPAVHVWTNAPVSDEVRAVSPAGWDRLPAAAATVAAEYDDPSTSRTATQLNEEDARK